MAKRSRDDFESSSPELIATPETDASTRTAPPDSPGSSTFTSTKIVHLDTESGETSQVAEMRCSLPPHRQTISFASYVDYDVHYAKFHTNRCAECRRNFPTTHFLNLHIEENHDSLVGVRRERGEKTYGCFVEDCERKCSTAQKRRMHLIDKHLFPKDYDFYVVNDGIDCRSSMLRSGRHRRRSSAAQHVTDIEGRARRRASTLGSSADVGGQYANEKNKADVESSPPAEARSASKDLDIDGLSSAMSSLRFVPSSVKFGRGGRARGGFSRT